MAGICVLGASGLWASHSFAGERTALTTLLLYAPQHAFVLAPALLGVLGAWKRRPVLALAGALAALAALDLSGWKWRWPDPPIAPEHRDQENQGGQSLRVMSFNVHMSQGGYDNVAGAIAWREADIVCLQETQVSERPLSDDRFGRSAAAALIQRLPGYHHAFAGDVLTLSRFPLVSQREWPLMGDRRILDTVLQTPSGPVRVLNVHVSTYVAGRERAWGRKRYLFVLENIGASGQARLQQIEPLRAAIAANPPGMPLIVAGDFNTPPRGWLYRSLTSEAGLSDAFARRGGGWGHTFHTRLPVLRIDYIFFSEAALRAERFETVRTRTSDHLPVIVDLARR